MVSFIWLWEARMFTWSSEKRATLIYTKEANTNMQRWVTRHLFLQILVLKIFASAASTLSWALGCGLPSHPLLSHLHRQADEYLFITLLPANNGLWSTVRCFPIETDPFMLILDNIMSDLLYESQTTPLHSVIIPNNMARAMLPPKSPWQGQHTFIPAHPPARKGSRARCSSWAVHGVFPHLHHRKVQWQVSWSENQKCLKKKNAPWLLTL